MGRGLGIFDNLSACGFRVIVASAEQRLQTDEQTKQEDAPRRKRDLLMFKFSIGRSDEGTCPRGIRSKKHSQAMIALHYLKTDSNGSRKIFPRFE